MINLKLLSKEISFFHKLKSLLVLFVLLSTSSLYSQQLAFPGAEGFGKYATGGRGGLVYKVTNLNDNGPGSLREAVEAFGPRTVIFEVSGTIDLNGNLDVTNNDLTIAGQTAPGGGICLKGASFSVRASNIIVRYIRIRLGDNGYKDINGNVVGNDGGDIDTVQISAAGRTLSNIIFDHCSISWSIDENLSTWADGGSLTNVSFSNNLISHALNESHHGDGGHSMSTLSQFNLRNISYIKNMFVGSSERHPRINVGVNLEWHNNLIDGFTSGSVASYGTKIDAENNHYKQGNYTLAASATGLFDLTGSGYTTEGVTYTREDSRMHIFGNTTDAVYPPNNLPVSEIKNSYYNITNEPNRISDSGYSIVPVTQNITEILQNVGAILPLRDSYDTQLINNYINDIKANRIDTQLQVGGYPVLLSLPAPEDSDNDGMPNDWELSYGLNTLNPDDRNTINTNGYTNLEHYLNGIDVDPTGIIPVSSVSLSPESVVLNVSETIELIPTILPIDATNQNGIWTSDDITIATVSISGVVTATSEGQTDIRFTTNDGSFTDTSSVTVTDIYIPLESVSISPQNPTLDLGQNVQLAANFFPSNASDRSGNWSSNNPSVAEVDENGLITSISKGAAEILFVANDNNHSNTTIVNVVDNFFGTYQFYNASTDILIANIETDMSFDISEIGNAVNFRSIPEGGDDNIAVESVEVIWDGPTSGTWIESAPLYAGMSNHNGLDFAPYIIGEGTYNFNISYYSENSGNGNVIAVDTFSLTFFFDNSLTANAGEDISICEGESTTLVASGGTTYLWNTGAVTASIEVNPTETTTYSVVVSNDEGEQDTDEVIVTVNKIPIADAGEDQTICEGELITLTATGGVSYLWSNGETTASIDVNPSSDTTYSVEVSSNNCSSTDSVTVFVFSTPNLTVSDDVVIVDGQSTMLTANGGTNYLWSTGETTASISVTPTVTTTYTVSSVGANGCSISTDVTVTVIPEVIADAGQDATICSGETLTLSASGGSIYLWNTGQTTADITISPLVSTTYTVTVEDDYGYTDTDSVTITANESPNISVSNDVTIMDGDSTTLIANGGDNYLWNTGETTASIVVSPSITTTYTVSSLGVNNCEDTEDVTVTVIPELIANAGVDTAICNGDSITLNATGGIIYTWNTGETGSQLTVSPTVTTTYTVTVEDGLGNSDTDSVTITVNETPNVIVSENITIVEGESTDLNVSGGQTYQWSTGETASSITVSPSQTTTYTVIATANTCSIEAQVTVTVLSVFQASAGEDERVCQNDNNEVVLTANQGDSYLWNTGETTQSIIVNPLATSTYTVTVTQGSQEDTADVTVYVDPNPEVVILNGDTIEILNGEFVTLSASGANSYEWNNGATQPNIAVSPSVTTTYEVSGYIGDCSDEKQVTVKVIPKVIADAGEDVSICLAEVTTLGASGGDEYLWSTGETTQSIQVSPDVTTEYTVTVFNALDFDEDSVIVGVDLDCYGDPSDDPQDFDFDIFPNPASNFVNIRLSGSDILTHVYLYDMTGKLLQSTRISNESMSNSSNTKINIRGLQSGIYYIKLVDINQELTKKLIVK